MKDIQYKQYTTEENTIYNDSIEKILISLRSGKTLEESCREVEISDKSLMGFIYDDAMKVMIAELHFRDGISLSDIADRLNIPIGKIFHATLEMLEDVAISSSEAFNDKYPDFFKSLDA